jgi:hypothetical protein
MLQCKNQRSRDIGKFWKTMVRSNWRASSPRVHFLIGAVAPVFILDCIPDCTARLSARNTVGIPFSKHQGSHTRNSAFVIGRILRPRDGRVAETGR